MESRLCQNSWAPISIAIKDPKRGTTMAILALAEGAQNDQNERGEGGSSLWVPNVCGKQVLHLKEVSVSSFNACLISLHITLAFRKVSVSDRKNWSE
jgi:hypothetical protein